MPRRWEQARTRTDKTMKTISICNQKGGVGKTTTALCLTAGMSEQGKRVLLIDAEGQRNITATLGATDKPALLEVLTGEATAQEALTETAIGAFISGNKELSRIDRYLDAEDRFTRLRDALKPLHRRFDIAVIDTPPYLGSLTLSALTASDYVIIPCIADLYSLYGLTDLNETIEAVKANTNKKLRTMGVLLTMYSERARLSRELEDTLDELTTAFNTTLFETTIRRSIKASEAQFRAEGLLKYARRSTVAEDYRALTEEVLQRLRE